MKELQQHYLILIFLSFIPNTIPLKQYKSFLLMVANFFMIAIIMLLIVKNVKTGRE